MRVAFVMRFLFFPSIRLSDSTIGPSVGLTLTRLDPQRRISCYIDHRSANVRAIGGFVAALCLWRMERLCRVFLCNQFVLIVDLGALELSEATNLALLKFNAHLVFPFNNNVNINNRYHFSLAADGRLLQRRALTR
jgi:hypothetical protein